MNNYNTTGESVFGKSPGASPSKTAKWGGGQNSHLFSEGNLYKQVVTFQSGRGQILNDAAILKNSISSVQRRADR